MKKDFDYAIQFEKYDLGYGIYVFKPVGVLEGEYDRSLETFQSKFGELYDSIKKCYSESYGYFYAPYNLEQLKEMYNEEDLQTLLNFFYQDFLNYIYIGLSTETEIDIAALNIDSIGNLFEKGKDNNSSNVEAKIEEDVYYFTEDGLKALMNLNSLKEIRKKITDLIQSGEIDLETVQNEDKTNDLNSLVLKKENSKKLRLSELRDEVLSNIIGQDNAVKSVATTMIVNENSNNPRHKSHILIAGPSGTGKTEIMNVISKKMNKPVFKADSTAYTKEGFVGKSVYSMLKGLIEVAGGDLEKAQNGILIIDEIDKKVSVKGENDPSGTAVINSLLKIMDRDIIEVDNGREEAILFNTSNLTMVFMGAFSDLYEEKEKARENRGIGFNVLEKEEDSEIKITKQDLIDYGVPPEFLGRISNITYTKDLDKADLIQILKKSKISPLKLEEEFFKDLGIKFNYTNGYIKQLAENCLKRKTGARELKSEVQKSLEKVYEEVLDHPGKIKTLKLTKKTALNNEEYCIN